MKRTRRELPPLDWTPPPMPPGERMILDYIESAWPRVTQGRRQYIIRPDGRALVSDAVGKSGQRWATSGQAVRLAGERPGWIGSREWDELRAAWLEVKRDAFHQAPEVKRNPEPDQAPPPGRLF